MQYATKEVQVVIRDGDYQEVNLARAEKKVKAQTLQSELNHALKKVQELNEAQQQAQFDWMCLENKMKYLKQVETLERVSQVFYLTDETISK